MTTWTKRSGAGSADICCTGECNQGRACPRYPTEAEQDRMYADLSWKWAHRAIGAIGLGCIAAVIASATGVLS
jgi:hypothetical protein